MNDRYKWIIVIISIFLLFATSSFAKEQYVELAKKNCVECHTDKYYVAEDFFLAETFSKWYYHMWAFSIAAFLFLAGLIWRIYIWGSGEGNPFSEIKDVERKRFWNFFIFEVFFQKKIFKENKVRWFIFVSESMGFILLFWAFMFTALVRFYLKIDFFIDGSGALFLDFMLDLLGLLILTGTIVSFIRRMTAKENMMTERKDIAAVVLLFFVVVTGFLMEGFKFAQLPVTPESYFSFAGFAISSVLRHIELPWTDIRHYFWLGHATLAFVFIAYIPYSKIMHAIACPVTTVISSSDPQS